MLAGALRSTPNDTFDKPNPAGGTWDTNYKYSQLSQLLEVTQTRGGTTQTRSYVYDGGFLTQTTTPEQGTTNYYYDSY